MTDNLKTLASKRRDSRAKQAQTVTNDPLGALFHLLKMESVFYTQADMSAPWGMDIPAIKQSLMFHFVVRGHCVIDVEGSKTSLESGDFLMVPHGLGHQLFDHEQSRCVPLFDLPIVQVSDHYETLSYGGQGDETLLLCGAVSFNHPIASRLLETMPAFVKVDTGPELKQQTIFQLIRMLADESLVANLGGEAVITRVADILVIHALRDWLESISDDRSTWLAALKDPALGKAMAVMHHAPEKPWTVETLALEAGMSRTSFAEKFKAVVGESPLQYLTKWRMILARTRLRSSNDTVLAIALDLGYQSEAAFSRAYKKTMGKTPGGSRKGF
jgi:AraC-like DNA-binding protein